MWQPAWRRAHLDQRRELRLALALDGGELALVDPIGRELAGLIDADDTLEQLALRWGEIDRRRGGRLGRRSVAGVGSRCERSRARLGPVRPSGLPWALCGAR